jgi:nicrotizing toxin Mtb-like protein
MKSSRIFAAATITVFLASAAPATAAAATTTQAERGAATHGAATHSTLTHGTVTHGTLTHGTVTRSTAPHGPIDDCSAAFFDGDKRLGPEALPSLGVVGFELVGYHRTGGLSPTAFLAMYYNPNANSGMGGWIYPPDNGYVVGANGQPIEWRQQLRVGQQIDRYGSEYGSFLAPAGSRYASRSIPPQNLDGTPPASCNYHDYRVLKPFVVDAGPVAPWFAQPGHGLQYQVDSSLIPGAPASVNVLWLINNGYLARVA